MIMHPARRRRTAELGRLNPDRDWQEIYRRTVLWEFPVEARLGFQLAFYRPLAVPRMARVLAGTGHLKSDTTRRAYDTGIVMHEIIYNGFDSPRARKMVRLMVALHNRPDIYQEDLTYVLNALIVVPTRFMERAGWRPLTDAERTATCLFYRELGNRMGIRSLPETYPQAMRDFDSYEDSQLDASEDGAGLTAATLLALKDRLPRPLRRQAAMVTSALLNDARFCAAVSLPAPRRLAVPLIDLAFGVRKLGQRLSPPPDEPSFTPGQAAGGVYPHGYQLDEIGPKR
jgi:hypothetical protein